MLRSHTCGELRLSDKGKKVQLSGWVQKVRDKGKLVWIDIRDRYGITQLIFEEENTSKDVFNTARKCGREFVIFVEGNVSERSSKNDKLVIKAFQRRFLQNKVDGKIDQKTLEISHYLANK